MIEALEHGLDARSRRKGAVEAHVEELALDLRPWGLADDEVAADVDEDVLEARLHAQVAEAAAIPVGIAVLPLDVCELLQIDLRAGFFKLFLELCYRLTEFNTKVYYVLSLACTDS